MGDSAVSVGIFQNRHHGSVRGARPPKENTRAGNSLTLGTESLVTIAIKPDLAAQFHMLSCEMSFCFVPIYELWWNTVIKFPEESKGGWLDFISSYILLNSLASTEMILPLLAFPPFTPLFYFQGVSGRCPLCVSSRRRREREHHHLQCKSRDTRTGAAVGERASSRPQPRLSDWWEQLLMQYIIFETLIFWQLAKTYTKVDMRHTDLVAPRLLPISYTTFLSLIWGVNQPQWPLNVIQCVILIVSNINRLFQVYIKMAQRQ